MGLTKTTVGVTNISDLSSTPNATEGLTAAQLQAKFDKTGADLKTYINDTLTVEQDIVNTQLANVSKYIVATAATNGDYKINITNALSTGMVLYISFPVATTNTQNARLSIDNGTTYKNIKLLRGATTMVSLLIENKNAVLKFDGTQWVWINTNLVAYAEPTGSPTSFTISNLNGNEDGGYLIDATIVNGSGSQVSPNCYPNAVTTAYEVILFKPIASLLTANDTMTLATTGIYRTNYGFCFLGDIDTGKYMSAKATANVVNGIFNWKSDWNSVSNGSQKLGTCCATRASISNITSLYFSDTTFGTGTKVYVYKNI